MKKSLLSLTPILLPIFALAQGPRYYGAFYGDGTATTNVYTIISNSTAQSIINVTTNLGQMSGAGTAGVNQMYTNTFTSGQELYFGTTDTNYMIWWNHDPGHANKLEITNNTLGALYFKNGATLVSVPANWTAISGSAPGPLGATYVPYSTNATNELTYSGTGVFHPQQALIDFKFVSKSTGDDTLGRSNYFPFATPGTALLAQDNSNSIVFLSPGQYPRWTNNGFQTVIGLGRNQVVITNADAVVGNPGSLIVSGMSNWLQGFTVSNGVMDLIFTTNTTLSDIDVGGDGNIDAFYSLGGHSTGKAYKCYFHSSWDSVAGGDLWEFHDCNLISINNATNLFLDGGNGNVHGVNCDLGSHYIFYGGSITISNQYLLSQTVNSNAFCIFAGPNGGTTTNIIELYGTALNFTASNNCVANAFGTDARTWLLVKGYWTENGQPVSCTGLALSNLVCNFHQWTAPTNIASSAGTQTLHSDGTNTWWQ